MKKVLLAGISGYLGSYIAKELRQRGYFVRGIARNPKKLKGIQVNEIIEAEVTRPNSIEDCCKNIDIVISTIGITKQKDGLTYLDVDYQANMNVLHQAKESGVKKFIYVSVLNGENLRHLQICSAKEMFVDKLQNSGLDYCVIRPNGFFSDMAEFFTMAKKGRVYLFSNGELKANPIHGEDLARVCVDAIENAYVEIEVGGPETLTQKEMATSAFEILGTQPKITYIPEWVRLFTLRLLKIFTGRKVYGPIEFFMTVMAMDMVAPEYGKHTLKNHFSSLNKQ